jgi:hypothetical protein
LAPPRVSLADVAGLQICVLDFDECVTKHTYELNLVLREPAGERITLLDACGRKKIDRLAQRLGAFLSFLPEPPCQFPFQRAKPRFSANLASFA